MQRIPKSLPAIRNEKKSKNEQRGKEAWTMMADGVGGFEATNEEDDSKSVGLFLDIWYTEPVFLNVYGAQESIPRN